MQTSIVLERPRWLHRGREQKARDQAPVRSPARTVEAVIYTALSSLAPVWREVERDGDRTVFQTFEVFAAWVRHIAEPNNVRWLAAALHDRKTGAPLLILPLTVTEANGLKIIECADRGIADFNGPVIARGFVPSAADMAAYWDALKAALPPADLVRLSKLPARLGQARNPLLRLPNVHAMKLSNWKADLAPDFPGWLERNVPEKLRADLAQRRRKLGKRGPIEFKIAETEAEADRLLDELIAERQERFEALGRRDLLADEHCRRFYRSLIRPGDGRSPAVIQALMVGGEIVATGYGLVHNDAFHMIFPGFAGKGWRNYSPGLQLFLASMEWAAGLGLKHYDFTIGDEGFKRDLGAEEHLLYEKLAALSPRGRRVVYLDRLRRFVRRNPMLARALTWLRGETPDEVAP